MPAPFSPGRLGAAFTRLWTASAVSNLGDGVTGVAGPLLVASLTDSPALVAGAALAQRLPWLLFSLPAGAWVDRLDRRRLLVAVNGETLSDSTSVALVPSIVPAEGLARANARLLGTYLVGNQLLAPPFGAFLFVVVPALPFAFDAASFLVAALLVAPLALGRGPATEGSTGGGRCVWRSPRGWDGCGSTASGVCSAAPWPDAWTPGSARPCAACRSVGATLVLFGTHATVWGSGRCPRPGRRTRPA